MALETRILKAEDIDPRETKPVYVALMGRIKELRNQQVFREDKQAKRMIEQIKRDLRTMSPDQLFRKYFPAEY